MFQNKNQVIYFKTILNIMRVLAPGTLSPEMFVSVNVC